MSVTLMLNNALTGLNTNQAALTQVSNNVSNVNTPGYVRRVVDQQAISIAGQPAGVAIADVRRVADTFLAQQALSVQGDIGRYETEARIHDSIQSMLGGLDDQNALTVRINEAMSAISETLLDPTSAVARSSYLSALDQMALRFSQIADEIQTLRTDADAEIQKGIDNANRLIEQIDDLNIRIQKESFQSNNASALLDQRDAAIRELGQFIDLSVRGQADGSVLVATRDGVPLVGASKATLEYDSPGAVTAATQFPPITISRVTSTGIQVTHTDDLTGHLAGGELKGLLHMRDVDLPNLARQVGALGGAVMDALNAAHNDNAAVPAPNTLVGRQTGLLAADAHNFTGGTTIAVTDGSGALVTQIDLDFTAGTYSVDGAAPIAFAGATIGDVVTAIDTALGANGSATFSNGVLTIDAATAGEGVALLQDAAAPSDRGGRGFSHVFGLNDLIRSQSPSAFETGLTAGDAYGFTGTTVINVVDGGGAQTREITIDFTAGTYAIDGAAPVAFAGTTVGDLAAGLNMAVGAVGTFALDADGALVLTPAAGFENHRLVVGQDGSARGATGVSFSTLFGVGGVAQMEQARDMAVLSDISANPARLAFAKLDLSGAPAVGDIVLSDGDNRGALALQGIQSARFDIPAAGSLAATNGTLDEYAATVVADAASRASVADMRAEAAQALSTEIESRRAEVEGVNLDEELANMVVFQQAYNASARMVNAAQELFDVLLNVV